MSKRMLHPGQLKMFMTPREIESDYQPLDADRYPVDSEYDTHGTDDTRAGAGTNRSHRTDGVPNNYNHEQPTNGGPKYLRPSASKPVPVYSQNYESDDDVWDRKLEEAEEASPSGYNSSGDSGDQGGGLYKRPGTNMPTESTGTWLKGNTRPVVRRNAKGRADAWRHTEGHTTYESRDQYATYQQFEEHTDSSNVPQGHSMSHSIETQGVLSPIRLGSQFGSSGKKEIVGGHHRMAVARAVAPDRLVPVLHHSGIREARSNFTKRAYPYT